MCWWLEIRKVESLSIDSDVEFSLWEHFIKEYFTQFGGLLRLECAALGLNKIEPAKHVHVIGITIQILIFLSAILAFPHTELGLPVVHVMENQFARDLKKSARRANRAVENVGIIIGRSKMLAIILTNLSLHAVADLSRPDVRLLSCSINVEYYTYINIDSLIYSSSPVCRLKETLLKAL